MAHLNQASSLSSPPPRVRKSAARSDQTRLEIHPDAFSDESINGLLETWFVPMIVDHIVEGLAGYGVIAGPLSQRGNYEYDNLGTKDSDDKESKRWTPTKTDPVEEDVEAPIDVDGNGIQNTKRVCDANGDDGK